MFTYDVHFDFSVFQSLQCDKNGDVTHPFKVEAP